MEDVLKTVESAPETTKAQKANKKPPASRVRPLSLKIPVTLQGTLPSANSEEFCEETNTIIVFQYGAVVRLSACVNVGQLVVLTNRNTNQEVLCSVVKIKADPDTKDYVELQFSQAQHGFWQQDGQESESLAETRRDPEEPRRETPRPRAAAAGSAETPTGSSTVENRRQDRYPQISATSFEVAQAGSNHSSSSDTSVAVLENPSSTEATQLNSREIKGDGFWDTSFPQEILAVAATATSGHSEASTPQPEHQNPANGNRPYRSALRPEVIPFQTQDEHVIVRGDLLAKAKIGIAALGLVAMAGVVGVAMRAHRSASPGAAAPLSTAAPAVASDIDNPTTPEVDVPASPVSVARENLRKPDAEQTDFRPQENTHSNTDGTSVSTKTLPLSSSNLNPILETAAAKPVGESTTPQVAASRESLPLDLNPKFDDPAPGPRSLSMPAPAAISAPLLVGGKFQQARLISSAPPIYPDTARNLRIEGSVVVHGTIDVNGQVTNMSVISGATVLRPAALESIRKWKYAPGLLDGKPAPSDVDITVEFHIH